MTIMTQQVQKKALRSPFGTKVCTHSSRMLALRRLTATVHETETIFMFSRRSQRGPHHQSLSGKTHVKEARHVLQSYVPLVVEGSDYVDHLIRAIEEYSVDGLENRLVSPSYESRARWTDQCRDCQI